LFFFTFGWKVFEFFDIIFLLSLGLIFWVFVIRGVRLSKRVFVIAATLFVLSSYSLLIVILNGALDLLIALRAIRALVNFLGGAALTYLYWVTYRDRFVKHIVFHLYLVLVTHGALMIATYFNEGLRTLVYTFTFNQLLAHRDYPFIMGYRVPGLTSGGADTSVVQMFGLLLLPVALVYKSRLYLRLTLLGGAVVLVISIFLIGRTGLLFMIFLLPLVCGLIYIPVRQSRYLVKGVRELLRIGIWAGVVALLFLGTQNILPEHFKSYNLKHSNEVIEVFAYHGHTNTIDVFSTMFFVPERISVFLFGSSNLGRGALGYIYSDVGYVRCLFALGLVGTVLMLLPFIYGIWQVLAVRHIDRSLGMVTFVILLSSVFLHIKEIALLTRNQWSIQSLLLCSCFLVLTHHGIRKKNMKAKVKGGRRRTSAADYQTQN